MTTLKRFRNPVLRGFYPDPSICRAGDRFYLVNSSFEFFPGLPIHSSRNLVDWDWVGYAYTRKSQFDLTEAGSSRGLFAPTLRFHDGMFYLCVTDVSVLGNCILHSRDIGGPWSDPMPVAQTGIDPSLFFDDDGIAYFCTNATVGSQQGIALSIVDPMTGKLRSSIRHICGGSGGRYPEAPHLYRTRDKYYLMLAEGGTEYGHMETLFRSDSPWGPYEPCPGNPILSHRNLGSHPIQGTGHADICEDGQGNWWAVCLGIRPIGPLLHNLGRETFLAPVHWDGEGWFTIGDNGTLSLEMEGKLGGPQRPIGAIWEPSFPADSLDPEWNSIRNPAPWRFTSFPAVRGYRIQGSQETLSDPTGSPAFLGRRQDEMQCRFQVAVKLVGTRQTETSLAFGEAGIAAYYNDSYHYEIYITQRDACLYVHLRRRIHDMEAETASAVILNLGDPVSLRIVADRNRYTFAYRETGKDWKILGSGLTAGLCSEGTHQMSFTGVYLGLYAVEGIGEFTDCLYSRE